MSIHRTENIEIPKINQLNNETLSINTLTYRSVNLYLIQYQEKFVLIDTGFTTSRHEIESELVDLMRPFGKTPHDIKLIILTHGDFDHIGNASYFKKKYGIKIAMHESDVGMGQNGDMFWNRSSSNPFMKKIVKFFLVLLKMGLKKDDYFIPDVFLENGSKLRDYGFIGEIIHIPGHSKGSIGFLLPNCLFLGDLLSNKKYPKKFGLIDNELDYDESIKKITALIPLRIYPGHGNPFSWMDFLEIK